MTTHAVHWDPAVVALVERERRRALNEAAEAIEAVQRDTEQEGESWSTASESWARLRARAACYRDAAAIVRERIPPP